MYRLSFLFTLSISIVRLDSFPLVNETISKRHDFNVNLNKHDVCPHVYDDPGGKEKYKLREIEVNGIQRLCCGCNPGYRVATVCK